MLAVAVHGENVAPRFCSTDQFLIAELDREQVRSIRRFTFPEEGWLQRLERLSAAGVRVLLCGGFNSSLLPLAENLRIRVFSDLVGKGERMIDAFLRNELERYELLPYGTGHTGDAVVRGGHAKAMKRNFEDETQVKGIEPCRITTEMVRWGPGRAWVVAWAVAADGTTKPDPQKTRTGTRFPGGTADLPAAALAGPSDRPRRRLGLRWSRYHSAPAGALPQRAGRNTTDYGGGQAEAHRVGIPTWQCGRTDG